MGAFSKIVKNSRTFFFSSTPYPVTGVQTAPRPARVSEYSPSLSLQLRQAAAAAAGGGHGDKYAADTTHPPQLLSFSFVG